VHVSREDLVAHLLKTRLAGYVGTLRENNLRNYSRFARRDPDVLFGLDPDTAWSKDDVLALMARRCGVNPDPGYLHGPDTIDPELTVAALDRLAAVLRETVDVRGSVLLGTGHPAHLAGMYAAFGRALCASECDLRTPARGRSFAMHFAEGPRRCALDYRERVGVLRVYEESASRTSGKPQDRRPTLGDPVHTHSPQPVRIALAALAEEGESLPDLVIGDHGWACGAGRLGVRAVGFADSNDPAVFVAEATGSVVVTIPLDDGLRSDCYRQLTAYVLQQAGMSQ
jgi:hypothetical protein